ncbi:hypothetical protein BDW69DRAFT_21913 [Aspergillus filifer]
MALAVEVQGLDGQEPRLRSSIRKHRKTSQTATAISSGRAQPCSSASEKKQLAARPVFFLCRGFSRLVAFACCVVCQASTIISLAAPCFARMRCDRVPPKLGLALRSNPRNCSRQLCCPFAANSFAW